MGDQQPHQVSHSEWLNQAAHGHYHRDKQTSQGRMGGKNFMCSQHDVSCSQFSGGQRAVLTKCLQVGNDHTGQGSVQGEEMRWHSEGRHIFWVD